MKFVYSCPSKLPSSSIFGFGQTYHVLDLYGIKVFSARMRQLRLMVTSLDYHVGLTPILFQHSFSIVSLKLYFSVLKC